MVTIHAALPAFATDHLSQPVVELAASEMAARVEGETMSLRAAMRSANVSCEGSYASSWRSESERTESTSEPASDEADDQASSETSVTRTLHRRPSAPSSHRSVSREGAKAVRESWRWRTTRAGRGEAGGSWWSACVLRLLPACPVLTSWLLARFERVGEPMRAAMRG